MIRLTYVVVSIALAGLFGACGDDKEEATFEFASNERTVDGNPAANNGQNPASRGTETPSGNENLDAMAGCMAATIFGSATASAVTPAVGCGEHYAGNGLYNAGVKTVDLNGQPVEIWYPVRADSNNGQSKAVYDMRSWLPADLAQNIPDDACTKLEMDAYRDLPIEAGPFPVVVFSHGLAGYRMQSSAVMTHLAKWGFVVAAPEHAERGLGTILENGAPSGDDAPMALSQTIDLLETLNQNSADFQGKFDLNRIAAAGHSMGSAATASVSQEDRVISWVTLAGAGFGDGPLKPFLMMGGSRDSLATEQLLDESFDRQPTSIKRFVSIENAGHLAFTDICLVGRSQGGLLTIAQNYGLEIADVLLTLANDGCQEDALAPEYVFPVVNHYMVAHLRHSFGIDANLVGFDAETRACFGDRVADLRVVGDNPEGGTQEDVLPPLSGGAAPIETPAGPNLICCGESGSVCDTATSFCCSTWLGMACKEECSSFALVQACDGNEDCGGQKCCRRDDTQGQQFGVESFGTTCRDTCEFDEQELVAGVNICIGTPAASGGGFPGGGFPGSGQGNLPGSGGQPNQQDGAQANDGGDNTMGGQPPADVAQNQTPGVEDSVTCGGSPCDVTSSVCCIGLTGSECLAGNTCGSFSAPQFCDGPEDCGGGEICCVGFPSGSSCVAADACPSGQNEMCHMNSDCRNGDSCLSCNPPGSPEPSLLCGTSCPF